MKPGVGDCQTLDRVRVTYTREIDFDDQGRVYSSNSNLPLQHVEGGLARIIRLDPR